MNKITFIFLLFFVLIINNKCNKNSYLDSPNSPSVTQIDPDLYLNRVQINLPVFINEIARIGGHLVRAEAMPTSLYNRFEDAQSLNDVWRNSYRGILINIKKGQDLSLNKKMYTHYAIMETLKAYTLMTLVDYFGDIPYTEALDETNLNPKLDKGIDVYQLALASLNNALYNFSLTASLQPANDLYYSNKKESWIKLINSLKLRYFVQTRLVQPVASKDSINALLVIDKFISNASEDFQFQYGKNVTSPDSRNPTYVDCYTTSGVGNGSIPAFSNYLGTYGMNKLRSEGNDPRWRFLIYRQASVSSATTDDMPCTGGTSPSNYQTADLFCNDGVFWGRNHGDPAGIPPDTKKRTTWGLYPVGGSFDQNKLVDVTKDLGALGAGVFPMITSSIVRLYRLEAALTLSTSDKGTETTLLSDAMDGFSTKLLNFKTVIAFSGIIDTSSTVFRSGGYAIMMKKYITDIKVSFDAANDAGKLKIAVNELYKCSWGNGMEVYNTYRRTGYPDNLQPTLTTNPGVFPRSMYYPQEAVLYNKNITQKLDLAQRVFWDDGSTVLK